MALESDQAESLRKMTKDMKTVSRKAVTCITVASGKGGVGKTTITVNMAIAFAKLGKKVLLVDADLGLANADILMGMSPEYSIEDAIFQNMPLKDVVLQSEYGVDLLPASSGGQEMLKLGEARMKMFIEELLSFASDYDILLFDCSAGIDPTVTSFIAAAPQTILVTTPQPTALMDVYALMKVIHQDNLSKSVSLILNQVKSKQLGEKVFEKLQIMAENYLAFNVDYCGSVTESPNVIRALRAKTPLIEHSKADKAAQDIRDIAKLILQKQKGSVRLRNLNAQGLLDGLLKR